MIPINMPLCSKLQNTFLCKSYLSTILLPGRSDEFAYLTDEHQAADIMPTNIWHILLIYPVESCLIALLVCLLIYFYIIYNGQLLAREKLQLTFSLVHRTQTSLALMRNQLDEIITASLPERTTEKIKLAIEYNNHVIDSFQNIVTLYKIKANTAHQLSITELELYTYIISIIQQCRVYANTHHVQLKINKCLDYINCRINEAIMTVAIQHLLYRMIEFTTPNNCINITISHFTGHWKLSISSCIKSGSNVQKLTTFISALLSVYSHGKLRVVKKIIHLHGGKITCSNHRDMLTFIIMVPINHRSLVTKLPEAGFSKIRKDENHFCDTAAVSGTACSSRINGNPHVLLLMTDKKFSTYLNKTFSGIFQITVLENPESVFNISIHRNPDIIIVDEYVDGMDGDELCYKIKSDKTTANIPVILLINSDDNESYLSHIHSRADRLELRMINIYKLRVDISMLIDNHIARRERVKQFLVDNSYTVLSKTARKDDGSQDFMNKVQDLLEKNLFTEKYTVDMLSMDMGMCRTAFFNKMKEITGKPPIDYMFSFKMNRAKELLLTQQYSITEIATMLGYCDAKYFGRKFKDFYHVCPTKYLEGITG